jgi:hypothetical protein
MKLGSFDNLKITQMMSVGQLSLSLQSGDEWLLTELWCMAKFSSIAWTATHTPASLSSSLDISAIIECYGGAERFPLRLEF